MSNDAASVLAQARKDVGYWRHDDPQTGTKFGRWYAQGHGSYYGENGVPYCAMAVSYWFAMAGAVCAGLPEAYCPYILSDARAAGAVLADKTSARPGDVVLFDWDGGVVDHVGVVELNRGSHVQTIEGNVGGCVARRTRAWSDVTYVVRPAWGGASSGGGSGGSSGGASLLLDCDAGVLTFQAWARQLGLSGSDADGYLNYQYSGNKPYMRNISSALFRWYSGCPGSPTVKAIQRAIGSENVDGVWGKVDTQNLQRHMNETWGYHMVVDGDFGPTTAYNVQHSINGGFWG